MKRRTFHSGWELLLSVTLLLAWLPASAEEPTVRTVEEGTLQQDDPRRPSAMVTRVATDDLFLRGQDLGDGLLKSSGVYVRRDSGAGPGAFLSVRGGNSRQLVVSIDGLRLSAPAGMGFDLGLLSPEAFSSVDVYRGSGAAVFGAGAVTGALRLNPARAPNEGWQVRARTLTGSFGTAATSLSAGAANEVAGLRLHAGMRTSRGDYPFVDDQGTDLQRVNNDFTRYDVGATGHLAHREHTFRLTALFDAGAAGAPGPSEFQQAFSRARHDDRRALASLRWERADLINTPSVQVDSFASFGLQERRFHYHNRRGFLTAEPFENRGRERTAALTGGASAFLGTHHIAHLEVEGRLEDYDSVARSLQDRQLSARRQSLAMGVSDEWLLLEERLSLVAALRSEVIWEEGHQAQTQLQARPFLPALGAVLRARPGVELRANLARTFRLPDFDELYLDTEGVRGNPDLSPEEAWTSDVALRLGDASSPLVVQTSYFYNQIDAMILFLPVSAHLFEAQNLSGARAHGAELALQARPLQRLFLEGGYTFTRAFLAEASLARPAQLPHQPLHRLAIESRLDLSGLSFWEELAGVELTTAVHYRSRVNLDNFENLHNAPLLRVDGGLFVAVTESLRGGLSVQNILDHRRAQDSLHRPLPGRALYLSVEILASPPES